MAKRIKQIRYYEDNSEKNSDKNLTYEDLVSGSAFAPYIPIVQLGVQALPGTLFQLNNSEGNIIIGNTGIFELELTNGSEITEMFFDGASIHNIRKNSNAYLIVDMIYEKAED